LRVRQMEHVSRAVERVATRAQTPSETTRRRTGLEHHGRGAQTLGGECRREPGHAPAHDHDVDRSVRVETHRRARVGSVPAVMLAFLQFDAPSVDLIERMLVDGRLPTLSALRKRGTLGPLEASSSSYEGAIY